MTTTNPMKQCEYIVPEVGMQNQHRCVFRASQGRFCNTHQRIFNRTGRTRGQNWKEQTVKLAGDAKNFLNAVAGKLTTEELEELRYLLGVRTPLKDEAWQNNFDRLNIQNGFYKQKLAAIKEILEEL